MIFVFGSNLGRTPRQRGRRKPPSTHYRAKWGQGEGPQGASYGIPTKDDRPERAASRRDRDIVARPPCAMPSANPTYDSQVTRTDVVPPATRVRRYAPLSTSTCRDLCIMSWFERAWRPYPQGRTRRVIGARISHRLVVTPNDRRCPGLPTRVLRIAHLRAHRPQFRLSLFRSPLQLELRAGIRYHTGDPHA